MIAFDLIDWASKAGTLPMQALLLLGLLILGLAIRSMHYENKQVAKEHMEKMDAKDASMSLERKERITMLMQLMKDDIETKQKLVNAVANNTDAISDLKQFIKDQTEIIRELCSPKIRRK